MQRGLRATLGLSESGTAARRLPGDCDSPRELPACIEFAESLRETVELCHGYRPSKLPEPIGSQAREQLIKAYQKMLAASKTAS